MAGKKRKPGKKKSAGDVSAKPRFAGLRRRHMPQDFSISIDTYRRDGTDRFGAEKPAGLVAQPMRGFEPTYDNIVDYIVRITHRIWEQKDIGYIYDTYSHDCMVWDDFGLQYGRDKIVADTVHTNNAFPDIRLVADAVIWAGDDDVGFHTSHRTKIFGTNTGYSRFGPPTGKTVKLWCIANCVARDNEIYREHVNYDTAGLVRQLGFDVPETARRLAQAQDPHGLPESFAACEPTRLGGQGAPPSVEIPSAPEEDIRAYVRAAFHAIWNRRDFSAIDRVYAPNVVHVGSTGRLYRGTGPLRSFVMSMVAMFPNLALTVDDLYWMGNPGDGFAVAIRWSARGTHGGNGPYGEPTGREVELGGITQWEIEKGLVRNEWMLFNEFGALMQICG